MKTIEVTIGKELRAICEQGQAEIVRISTDPSNVIHDIKQQLNKMAKGPSSQAGTDSDSLLDDIKHGRVNIPLFRSDYDDEIADIGHKDFQSPEKGVANGPSALGGAADIQTSEPAHDDTDRPHHNSHGEDFPSQDKSNIETSASKNGKRKHQGDDRSQDDMIEGRKQKKVKLTLKLKSKVSGEGDTSGEKKQKKTKGKIPDEVDTSEKKKQKKTKGKAPHEEDTSKKKKQKKTKDQVSNQSPKKGPKKGTKKGSKESV
jgi:hypothetical protein